MDKMARGLGAGRVRKEQSTPTRACRVSLEQRREREKEGRCPNLISLKPQVSALPTFSMLPFTLTREPPR